MSSSSANDTLSQALQAAGTPVTHGVVRRALCLDGLVLTETTHPPDMTLPRHSHPYPAVTFVLKGGFIETFGSRWVHECSELSLLFKPAGADHSNRYSCRGAHSFIIECTNNGELFEGLQSLTPQVGIGPIVADALATLAAFRSSAPEVSMRAGELAAALVSKGVTRMPAVDRRQTPKWLCRVADQARSETGGATLSGYAHTADVHPVYLARAFRLHFGMSIGEYMLRSRIDRAVKSLLTSEGSIADLALSLGFSDQSHLTRRFVRQIGLPPAQFQRTTRALFDRLRLA